MCELESRACLGWLHPQIEVIFATTIRHIGDKLSVGRECRVSRQSRVVGKLQQLRFDRRRR